MWIVQVALRRPYTFLVMALLILLATPLVLSKMSTDIFPEINISVISIVWNYTGLSAQEVGQRITAINERTLTTTVNDIEHIESQSLSGIAVIKIFFQPTANIPTAIAQVVAIEQAALRQLPPGILPPLVIKYSASSIPVALWAVGVSASQTLFDAGKMRANVRIAGADYTAAVATYRQTVLSAMEEVENGITGLTSLDRAATQADASVHSAQRAFDIASDRYKGGVDTYLDVITAEQTLLGNQRQAVQIRGQQFLTAVYLIKALGGGWKENAKTARGD